jgi:hypothetical protein
MLMWCRQCQQDVPVLASSEEGKSCCPRCGLDLSIVPIKRKTEQVVSSEDSLPAAPTYSSAGFGDWNADEQLQRIERELRINKKRPLRQTAESVGKRTRIDSAHADLTHGHCSKQVRVKSSNASKRGRTNSDDRSPKKKSAPGRDSALLAFLTWTAILLGVATLMGGGIALGCSVIGSRPDFWNYGLPFIVGGQIVLLVGLVMQLDRVWRDNRAAAVKLDEVDEELRELKNTAALLGTSHSPSSSTFYAHYAGGANAQLLLTDLKSQLDLLAIKIADNE